MNKKIQRSIIALSFLLVPGMASANVSIAETMSMLAQIESIFKQIIVLETQLFSLQKQAVPRLIVEEISCSNTLCITSIAATSTLRTMTITWQTNKPAGGKIWWGAPGPIDTHYEPTRSDMLSFSHTATFNSTLATSTPYYFVINAFDTEGHAATSTEHSYTTPAQ